MFGVNMKQGKIIRCKSFYPVDTRLRFNDYKTSMRRRQRHVDVLQTLKRLYVSTGYRSNIIVIHVGLTRSYISTLQDGNTVDFASNEDLRVSVQQNKIRLLPLSASANDLPTIQQVLDKVFDRRDLSATTGMLDGTESQVRIIVILKNLFREIVS